MCLHRRKIAISKSTLLEAVECAISYTTRWYCITPRALNEISANRFISRSFDSSAQRSVPLQLWAFASHHFSHVSSAPSLHFSLSMTNSLKILIMTNELGLFHSEFSNIHCELHKIVLLRISELLNWKSTNDATLDPIDTGPAQKNF